ncbi:hypothetical protein [uncultured Dokdonia sp.]|uniref:hypothetical protein n=1 Tax=uncultured Dokdonia sp. TaxID=575653 RepID=UPI002639FB3D|nr:hypothetical protein [uncultured Dokdonia sp.]
MKINIVTNNFKKATRYLNISMLIFCIFMIITFISLWFTDSDFMEGIFVIFLFASGVMLLISIFLLILRPVFKKTIEINENQIEALHINSNVDTSQIKEKAEITYFGNNLKIINDPRDYELNNTTVFKLLKSNNEITTTNTFIKSKWLDIPPREIFKSIVSALEGWN